MELVLPHDFFAPNLGCFKFLLSLKVVNRLSSETAWPAIEEDKEGLDGQ